MRGPTSNRSRPARTGLFWDLLTFDRLLTGPIIHLIYWAGLGVIALFGFFILGASIGLALREDSMVGWLLAAPVAVAGLLIVGAMVLVWRAMCEFYVAVFRISDDLHAFRRADEAGRQKDLPL